MKVLAHTISTVCGSRQHTATVQSLSFWRACALCMQSHGVDLIHPVAFPRTTSFEVTSGPTQAEQLHLARRVRQRLQHELRVCRPLHCVLLISALAVSRQLALGMGALRLNADRIGLDVPGSASRTVSLPARVVSQQMSLARLVHIMAGNNLLESLLLRRTAWGWRQWSRWSRRRHALWVMKEALSLADLSCATLFAMHSVADPVCQLCRMVECQCKLPSLGDFDPLAPQPAMLHGGGIGPQSLPSQAAPSQGGRNLIPVGAGRWQLTSQGSGDEHGTIVVEELPPTPHARSPRTVAGAGTGAATSAPCSVATIAAAAKSVGVGLEPIAAPPPVVLPSADSVECFETASASNRPLARFGGAAQRWQGEAMRTRDGRRWECCASYMEPAVASADELARLPNGVCEDPCSPHDTLRSDRPGSFLTGVESAPSAIVSSHSRTMSSVASCASTSYMSTSLAQPISIHAGRHSLLQEVQQQPQLSSARFIGGRPSGSRPDVSGSTGSGISTTVTHQAHAFLPQFGCPPMPADIRMHDGPPTLAPEVTDIRTTGYARSSTPTHASGAEGVPWHAPCGLHPSPTFASAG